MKKIWIVFVALVIAVSASFGYYVIENENAESKNEIVEVKLIINFGNGTKWNYNLTLNAKDATVLNALYEASKLGDFSIKTTYWPSYDSYFVDSIANAGGNEKYWIYYVNGAMGEVGADKKIVKEGDLIEWRLE
ncbi:MAG TPA: DUF4430 domain-containing protein [Thermoplasmatales archaeon]|nr:DUF4430 domain-containing protein [Thermoplasmatales archaeon]